MPKDKAKDKFPLEVSSAIAVVIILVKWSIFPPTIMTAPTSDIALPKPAKTTVESEYLASNKYAKIALCLGTDKEKNSSLYSSFRFSRNW